MTVAGSPSTPTEHDDVSREWLDALPWVHHSGRFQALHHDFAVRTTDPALGEYLEIVLRSLSSPGDTGSLYSVVDRGPDSVKRYSIFFNEERVLNTSEPEMAAKVVLWHVNREAVRRTSSHVIVHASAAAQAGRAVLLPAPAESGKSTLVAGLVQAGLRYLTDEAVAIDPMTARLEPYPRALSIDRGSWPVLPSLKPILSPHLEAFVGSQWQVDPNSIWAGAVAPAADPVLLIAPRFQEGAETRLEPISRSAALVVLGRSAFNLRSHGQRGLEALAEVTRRCTCYRLVMGDLPAAVDLVLDLVGEVPGTTDRHHPMMP